MTRIRQLARYQVRPEALEECLSAIREFVDYVKANEPGTLRYDVWQEAGDLTRFVHSFVFLDAEAHRAHSESEAVKRFAAVLYPNCLAPVEFIDYEEAATNAGAWPTRADGKICYVEIPAEDADRSAAFYAAVFGWRIRRHGDGSLAFDDSVGEVSGTWVSGRRPLGDQGLLFHIMVDDMEAALAAVVNHGGEIVRPVGADAPEITARFRDPGGNVVGLYQEPERESGG